MVGTVDLSDKEARCALQGFLAACRLGSLKDEEPSGGGAESLRHAFRSDFRRALKVPGAAPAPDADELQRQLGQLLRHKAAPAPFQPPPRGTGTAPGGGAGEAVDLEALAAALPAETEKEEEDEPAPRRVLVREEESAANLRKRVAQARKCLHDLDAEVTGLTRTLKDGRRSVWVQQMAHSSAETNVKRMVEAACKDLPAEVVEEERDLKDQEQSLRQALCDLKAQSSRWFSEAKHQDAILVQERDAHRGGEGHRILAKHPAGEVFLPTFPDDDSDDDGFGRGPPRQGQRPQPQRSGHGGRDSSDEGDDDEYETARRGGGRPLPSRGDDEESSSEEDRPGPRGPPPPPAPRQFRDTRGASEDDAPASAGGVGQAFAAQESDGSSSSSEEEEEDAPKAQRTAPAAATAVPPLRQVPPRSAPEEDEAEEVYSEDEEVEESIDTSRSL